MVTFINRPRRDPNCFAQTRTFVMDQATYDALPLLQPVSVQDFAAIGPVTELPPEPRQPDRE